MRKIREILRLRAAGKSHRQIGLSVGIGQSTVGDYLTRARLAGVSWPSALDDAALERALYPPRPPVPSAERGEPDWAEVHRELKRKGVTLFLLWEEYKSTHPNGFQYSWFCEHYRTYAGRLDLVMRQSHRAGETMFVDYAGQTIPVVNRDTGELREAQIFVAVLGASNYTFARASWTQSLPDWIDAHCRAFTFFGGVTETLVPDNLKTGVTHPHRYEPELNPTYTDMAAHYRVAVLPTRTAGHLGGIHQYYEDIGRAAGTRFWFHGLRNVFITVAERELMLPRSLTKRLVNHARDDDITEGYAADWTVEQLREPAQRVADRIDQLMNAVAQGDGSSA